MNAIFSILTQSLLLSIMAIGVYITYKILDFPDMTADGSYTFGATITAALLTSGHHFFVAILFSTMGGALAGMLSGILHTKLKITNLLSGILVMGMLYSINLRVMSGKANLPIFQTNHLLNSVNFFHLDDTTTGLLLSLLVVILVKIFLDCFLKTGMGYAIKGTGNNIQMIKSLGINVDTVKILALMISNGIISLSGSMMCQFLGFSDVNMGIGTLVLGIASIIIGISLFGNIKFFKPTTYIVIGTIIYQFTVFAALNTGLQSSDLKMITAMIIVIFLSSGKFGKKNIKKSSKSISFAKNSFNNNINKIFKGGKDARA